MKKIVVATVLLAAVATLVAGVSAINALNAYPLHHPGRGGRGGPWQFNATTTESVVEGVVVDADMGYLVVRTSSGDIRLTAPKLWSTDGQNKTWFRIFADDNVNIGDSVRLVVLTITHNTPRGATITIQTVKSITDLTTGFQASAVLPRAAAAQQT
ncbi:MAG: hypothetical protein NZ941_00885 [Candidatus Caldarchaeum sp.]|nr:hypothetical protein [Candidatus Caldarchaeum sp.]